MGSQGSSNLLQLNQILQQYSEIRHEKQGMILTHKRSQNTYLMKQMNFSERQSYEEHFRKINLSRQQLNNDDILSIVKIWSRQFSNLCSSNFKIYVVYQYPLITLKDEVKARNKANKPFQFCQIISILQTCLNAYSNILQEQQAMQFVILPEKIFIFSEGYVKVINKQLIDDEHTTFLNNNTSNSVVKYYLAPQKLTNTLNEQQLIVSDLYSIGMTILYACMLQQITEWFDINQSQININKVLNILTERYNQDFIQLLFIMVSKKPKNRINLNKLQKQIDLQRQKQQQGKKYNKTGMISRISQQYPYQEIQTKNLQNFAVQNKYLNSGTKITNSQDKNYKQNDYKQYNYQYYNRSNKSQIQHNSFNKQSFQKSERKQSYAKYEYSILDPILNTKNNNFQKDSKRKYSQGIFTDPKILELMIGKKIHNKHNIIINNQIKCEQSKEINKQNKFNIPSNKQSLKQISPYIQKNLEQFQPFKLLSSTINTNPLTRKQSIISSVLGEQQLFNKSQQQGQKCIFVKQKYNNGCDYEGMILQKNDKLRWKHGYGKQRFEDGTYFEGSYKNNMMHGRGTLYYDVDRPAYEGEWFQGHLHGKGCLYNQSAIIIQESFQLINFHMIGNYWMKYTGQFKFDQKEGNGKLMLTNGQFIEGQFRNDKLHGQAIFSNMYGQKLKAEWNDNILIN